MLYNAQQGIIMLKIAIDQRHTSGVKPVPSRYRVSQRKQQRGDPKPSEKIVTIARFESFGYDHRAIPVREASNSALLWIRLDDGVAVTSPLDGEWPAFALLPE
jgi:hypothetical protein